MLIILVNIHQNKWYLYENPPYLVCYEPMHLSVLSLSEQLKASRHLGRCTRSGSSGSSPVGGSSSDLQPFSSSAAPVVSPPFPGLWLPSVVPSPPSSPWLSFCPPLSLPLIGVFVQDSAWQVPQMELRPVHLEPKTMRYACALCSDSALNLRRYFRSRSSHLSLRLTVFQCRFRRIQICPMCWLCAVLTFLRLPMSNSPKLITSTWKKILRITTTEFVEGQKRLNTGSFLPRVVRCYSNNKILKPEL